MEIGLSVSPTKPWRTAGGPFSGHATLTNDLVSYWKLDETSGNRADSVGSNTLTDNNTVGVSPAGPSGTVASFVAANSESLSCSSLASASDYTYNVWVNLADVSTQKGIFSIGDANSYYQTSNPLIRIQSSQWVASVGAGYPAPDESVEIGTGGSSAEANTWTMLTVKYTASTKKVSISKNGGAFLDSPALVNAPLTTGLTTQIGGWGSTYLNGDVGRVGTWSRAFTQPEAAALFNSGNGKSYADLTAAEKVGLVSYWNLDEASGNRADSHGSNTLTDNNTVGSATATAGAMRNAAASFVAANSEYLDSAHNFTTDTSGSLTIGMWVKHTTLDNSALVLVGANSTTYCLGAARVGTRYFEVKLSDDTGVSFNDNNAINLLWADTNWHYVIIGWDASLRKSFMQVDNNTLVTSSVAGGAATTLKSVAGFSIPYEGNYYPTALYDEVGVWSRVLTDQERTDLYNAGAGRFY